MIKMTSPDGKTVIKIEVDDDGTTHYCTRKSPKFPPKRYSIKDPNGIGLGIVIEGNWHQGWTIEDDEPVINQTEDDLDMTQTIAPVCQLINDKKFVAQNFFVKLG